MMYIVSVESGFWR